MTMLRPPFHHKMALVFMIVIVVLIGLSSAITYWKFNDMMQRQVLRDLNQIMLQNKLNIDNLIGGLDKATQLLYADQTIMAILNKRPAEYMETYDDIQRLNNELVKYMVVPLGRTLNSYSISFFVAPEMPFVDKLNSSSGFYSGFYNGAGVTESGWYRDTTEADGRLVWFTDASQPRHIFLARLIKNPEALAIENVRAGRQVIQNVGVVVIGFLKSELGRQLEATKLTPSTKLLITDREGRPLYSYEPHSSSEEPVLGAYGSHPPDTADATDLMNRYPLWFDWQLVALIPLNEISGQATVVRYVVFTSALTALILGVLLAVVISNQITAPIRKLARTMKHIITTDHLDVYLEPPKSNDEVAILYKSFNSMMRRVQQLLAEVYESGVRLNEAELKALQAQINPHFLYNTLDSVNWLALESGVDPIVEINSSLADMYRYITKDANAMVTLEEELEQIRHYIRIQEMCYDNRFDTHFDISPELASTACPKLIIQPLVENAIVHGIEKSARKGRLDIVGRIEGKAAVLSVSDNGTGGSVQQLNAFVNGMPNSLPVSLGYGIRNVNRRIQLQFGEAYGLRYETNVHGGVTAVIRIPR